MEEVVSSNLTRSTKTLKHLPFSHLACFFRVRNSFGAARWEPRRFAGPPISFTDLA